MNIIIKESLESDLDTVLAVQGAAFGQGAESLLVKDLLSDPSAKPLWSILAFHKNEPVGHILFTKVTLQPSVDTEMSILAPLAVVPAFQKQGIGKQLIERGLEILKAAGVGLVFVLGDPSYYNRFGFNPALKQGLEATYPIPEVYKDAWMVLALQENILGQVKGKVICADSLCKPEYWIESE